MSEEKGSRGQGSEGSSASPNAQATTASPVLEVQGLHRVFESTAERLEVLRGLDFTVDRGEFVSIVGPSGSGKSTLLHILGGLDRPTEGRVLLEGTDMFSYSGSELPELRNEKVGFVFQFHHLLAEFSVLENVALPLLVAGRPEVDAFRQAEKVLADIGFSNRLLHRPFQLSGGEKSKASVARALVNEPAIVLADEPTGNLDAASSRQLMDLLDGLNRDRKVTMVVVTHNSEVAARAGRVLELVEGRLVQDG